MIKTISAAILSLGLFVSPVMAQHGGHGGFHAGGGVHFGGGGHAVSPHYNYGARSYNNFRPGYGRGYGGYGWLGTPYYYGGYNYGYATPYYGGTYVSPVFIGYQTDEYGVVRALYYNPSTGAYYYQ